MCQNNNNNKLIIKIQQFDNIKNLEENINKFDKYLKQIGLKNYEISVIPIIKKPNNSYIYYSYEDIDWWKLRADSLIKYLNTNNKNEFIIGLTNDDICCDVHGIKNFGILGLSYLNHKYNSCVISTFRIKNEKENLWKVIAHEFTHSYFSQGHCKVDNKYCLMQDAKKKPNFIIKDSLCTTCKEEIILKLK